MTTPTQKRPIALIALIVSTIALLSDLLSLLTVDINLLQERLTSIFNATASEQLLSSQDVGSTFFSNFDALWPVHIVFFTLLTTITYYEFIEKRIPNAITYPGMFLGIAFAAGYKEIDLLPSIYGLVFGIAFPSVMNLFFKKITSKDGIGLGAIKMYGMIGAFLGLTGLLSTIILSGFLSVFFLIFITVSRRDKSFQKHLEYEFEFGPLLAITSTITVIFYDTLNKLFL